MVYSSIVVLGASALGRPRGMEWGGRRVQDGEHMYTCGGFILIFAGPLGTPLGLAQRKRASPRGEAGTSGFLCVSDSDRRVPASQVVLVVKNLPAKVGDIRDP